MRLNRQTLTAPGGGGGGSVGAAGVDSTLEIAKAFSGIDFKALYYPQAASQTLTMTSASLYIQALWIPEDCTITGVCFPLRTVGNYTPSGTNRIGLYTWDLATQSVNQVGATPQNDTLWSTLVTTQWNTVALETPYNATKGLHFVGFIYSSSAQVTAPQLNATNFGNAIPAQSAARKVGVFTPSLITSVSTGFNPSIALANGTPIATCVTVGLY